ncbi:MAG TPA: prepilin peptidase [Caulobacteraceae bacterium]|nr:prepilin peptidase [Caulobacteraceae bacterium]
MPLDSLARLAIAAVFTGLMAWGAVSDVRRRLIPNRVVLAILALWLPFALANGFEGWLSALEAFALALALSMALWAGRIIGAGDSKLFAAAALYMGMGFLPAFALATALAGGCVALVSIASRGPQKAFAMIMLRGQGDWGPGVPYGVAIAAGAVAVMWAGLFDGLQPIAWLGATRAVAGMLHPVFYRTPLL